jgi:hypothetical protein
MRNTISTVAPVLSVPPGDAARAMAAAPLSSKQAQPEVIPANAPASTPTVQAAPVEPVRPTFGSVFPLTGVTFKMNIQDAGKPWQDGTVSQTIADCAINLGGIPGAYLGATRIVKKTKDGASKLDVQFPSTGGAFRRSVIDVSEDENAKKELAAWKALVIASFTAWRKDMMKNGAGAVSGRNIASGVIVPDSELTELGI